MVLYLISQYKMSIALKLYFDYILGQGVFMRLPYDEDVHRSDRKMYPSTLKNLHSLAEAFSNAYVQNGTKPNIVTGSSLDRYHSSFLDYAFSQGISIISASM